MGRQHPNRLLDARGLRRAVLGQPGDIGRGEQFGTDTRQLVETLFVGDGVILPPGGAPHDDRLEVLAAHDCAHARAAVGAIAHVDDGRIAHSPFAGWTDLRYLDTVVAQLLLQDRLHLARDLRPQVAGVAQLVTAVVHPQVDGMGCLALEEEAVEAGELHLGGKEAAALGVADGAGEGALGAGGHAALAGDGRAGRHTHGERQDVLGSQRIDSGGHLLEQVMEVQAHCRPGTGGRSSPGACRR